MIGELLAASTNVCAILTNDAELLEGETLTDYNNDPAGIRAMFYRSFKENGHDE